MMKLILVRHGETDWNKQCRVQGRNDIPLNERGLAQANAVAHRLEDREISAVYSSPMQRAKSTAGAIAKKFGLDVKELPGVTEINFGLWEGKDHEQLKALYPEFWNDWTWQLDPKRCAYMQSECQLDVLKRSVDALKTVFAENGGNATVAIISHTMPIKLIVSNAIGLPLESLKLLKVDNCSVCEINIDQTMHGELITWNEKGFLKKEGLI